MLIMHLSKTTAKATDDDGDVYCGRKFDDVGICIIGLVRCTLLKLKENMHGVSLWQF